MGESPEAKRLREAIEEQRRIDAERVRKLNEEHRAELDRKQRERDAADLEAKRITEEQRQRLQERRDRDR